jgi:hypothetical protein
MEKCFDCITGTNQASWPLTLIAVSTLLSLGLLGMKFVKMRR